MSDHQKQIESLTQDLVLQGTRVQRQLEASFEALFQRSSAKAAEAAKLDDEVDAVDVALEQRAVSLLTGLTRTSSGVTEAELRWILTIVKINNELERIADAGVDVTSFVDQNSTVAFPETFRIMANSVIGVLRDVNASFARKDPTLAKIVLQSQHAIARFKIEVVRDAEKKIAAGTMNVEFAFRLHEVAGLCELIADHCTNIAEQVIYASTGAIVRHTQACWIETSRKPQ